MSLQISLIQQLKQHKEETWDLRFSLDGKRLVSSDGEALYLWQRDEDGRWEYERSLPFRQAAWPCFTPDSKMIAFYNQDDHIQIFPLDGTKGVILLTLSQTQYAFSPDQRWIVSGDGLRSLRLWNLQTSESSLLPLPFPPFNNYPRDQETDLSKEVLGWVRFTPDGQRVVFGASSREGYVQICQVDLAQKRLTRQKTLPLLGIMNQAIAPNGKLLAIVHLDEVHVYDLESFQLLQKFPEATEYSYSLVAFSPDSQFLMSSKDDGTVDIWSVSTFERVVSFAAHPGLMNDWTEPIGGLDWSRTGDIATAGASVFENDMEKEDYTIKIWRMEN
jgi:WD40 repeat protein